MPVYMIVEITEISDKDRYAEYIRQVPALVAKFGGTYLVRGNDTEVIEGSWKPQRLVIVSFPSREKFRAWYASPEYRAIAPLRERSTRTNVILTEGSTL